MPARGAGHAEHVVEAHHDVGDDDRLDGLEEVIQFLDVAALLLGKQQLDADPDQDHAAGKLEIGQRHQVGGERRQDDHEHDDAQAAEQERPLLLRRRERSASESDDDGVVAAQNDVDRGDLKKRDQQIGGRGEIHPVVPSARSEKGAARQDR